MNVISDIGIIGVGVMGTALAKNFVNNKVNVSVFDIDKDKLNKLSLQTNDNLSIYYDVNSFVNSLHSPRKIILLLPDGKIIDDNICTLTKILSNEDIIMDLGNSFYKDTNRRSKELSEKGFKFLGIGISGGEYGALTGPSIMVGGPISSYNEVKPYLDKVAAYKNGEPCSFYAGEAGAGHFIKMVHNGIEYADMQLIAELYLFLKNVLNKTNSEIASIFEDFNKTELNSYLIEISSKILREEDPITGNDLIDFIKDESKYKGTGKWTSLESFELGADISTITSAFQARMISNSEIERTEINSIFNYSNNESSTISINTIKNAYYLAKICAYAQGFSMISLKAKETNWSLNLESIASSFRAGCIIQAELLEIIKDIYKEDSNISNILLSSKLKPILIDNINDLRKYTVEGLVNGIPMPVFTSTLTYLDQLKAPLLGANMVQAQRDFFGAHTFERTDEKGEFHHEWKQY